MNIEIWSIGKANEAFIAPGVEYYFKKIKPYMNISLEVMQLPKKQITQDIQQTKKAEGEMILKKLTANHHLILLDENGKQLDSVKFSDQLQQVMNTGVKTIVILIGGAYGVSEEIKKEAKQTISLSKMVYPHQLVRLIVAEQIYRAFTILHNTPYHHS